MITGRWHTWWHCEVRNLSANVGLFLLNWGTFGFRTFKLVPWEDNKEKENTDGR